MGSGVKLRYVSPTKKAGTTSFLLTRVLQHEESFSISPELGKLLTKGKPVILS